MRCFTLALLAAAIVMLISATTYAATPPEVKLIEQLSAAMQSGQLDAAQRLVATEDSINSSNPEVLFLTGQILAASNRNAQAVKAYEKALKIDDQPRIRLELASLFAKTGLALKATQQLQTVASMKPPPPANVQANIDAMQKQVTASQPWQLRASAGYLTDSNVNAGPVGTTATLFGVPFTFTPGTMPQADQAATASAQLNSSFALSPDWSLQTSFSANKVNYKQQQQFNSGAYMLGAGATWRDGPWALSVPVAFDLLSIGSAVFGKTISISPSAEYAINRQNVITASLGMQRRLYTANADREGNGQSAVLGYRYVLNEQGSFVGLHARSGRERTRQNYLDNDVTALTPSIYWALPAGFSIYSQLSVTQSRYRDAEPAYTEARNDNNYSLNINIGKQLTQSVSLALAFTKTRNQSNLAIYDFVRQQVALQLSGAY